MKSELYSTLLIQAYATAFMLEEIPLSDLLKAQKSAESMGPNLYPTLWIQNGKKLSQDMEIVSALLEAKVKIAKVKESSIFWKAFNL